MQQVDERLVKKIEALLNTKGCTEAEAQSRVAKAQELLEKYNLDMSVVGGSSSARKDQVRKGGLYSWQRNLWKAVAELNFCYYLSIKGLTKGSTYEHRIVGSHANVISTEHMAQYLQDTVERLAQQWAKDNAYKSVFVREAIAYREGMTTRLSARLQERREELVSAARKEAELRKQNQAQQSAASGSTALTILDVISSEADFNNDYLNGWELGTTARNRAESEARSAAWYRAYEEKQRKQEEWDAAHPEEVAERRRKEKEVMDAWVKKNTRKSRPRKSVEPRYRKATPEEERRSLGSYYEGYAKGESVGIDTQVAKTKNAAIR